MADEEFQKFAPIDAEAGLDELEAAARKGICLLKVSVGIAEEWEKEVPSVQEELILLSLWINLSKHLLVNGENSQMLKKELARIVKANEG